MPLARSDQAALVGRERLEPVPFACRLKPENPERLDMVHGQPRGFGAAAAVFNHPAAIPVPTKNSQPGSTPGPGAVQRAPGLVSLPPLRALPIMDESAASTAATDQPNTTLSTVETDTTRRHARSIGGHEPALTIAPRVCLRSEDESVTQFEPQPTKRINSTQASCQVHFEVQCVKLFLTESVKLFLTERYVERELILTLIVEECSFIFGSALH